LLAANKTDETRERRGVCRSNPFFPISSDPDEADFEEILVMASRESQGLQVALILFVMVTVVLAITTYVYFRKSEEKSRKPSPLSLKRSRPRTPLNTVQFETSPEERLGLRTEDGRGNWRRFKLGLQTTN